MRTIVQPRFGPSARPRAGADVLIAVVGPFAVGVGVMDDEAETRTIAAGRPLEHFEVAIGIAKGHHRAATDVLLMPTGLPALSSMKFSSWSS